MSSLVVGSGEWWRGKDQEVDGVHTASGQQRSEIHIAFKQCGIQNEHSPTACEQMVA
jgi:hypothetical protein